MGIFYVYSQFGSLFHIINLELTVILGAGFSIQYISNNHTHSIREIIRFLAVCPGWWVEFSSLPLLNRRMMIMPSFTGRSAPVLTAETRDYTAPAWVGSILFWISLVFNFAPQMSAVCLSVFPKHRDFMATSRNNSEKNKF